MQRVGKSHEKGHPAEVHTQKAQKVVGIQDNQQPATYS